MQHPRIYLDEDVYHAVAIALRRRGFDVLTTFEARRQGTSDEMQLRFAAAEGRAIFTFNRGDFARLHGAFLARGEQHYGILVARQLGIGPIVRMLARLLSQSAAEDMQNRLIWLAEASPRSRSPTGSRS